VSNSDGPRQPTLDFHEVYESWFSEVSRWIRAMGGPEADREDLIQDVFVVVHRRLPHFDGDNIGAWLYRIAQHRVRDFRRLAWFKHLFRGRLPLPENLAKVGASPQDSVETREKSALLARLLDDLGDSERAALVLFEVEGYAGEEIARLHGVAVSTVWSRIHSARKKLKRGLARLQQREARRGAR
jgi:RNA polymerase sigma-70 factor (ECF subfamily)